MKKMLPQFFYRMKFQILAPLVILFSVVASSSLIIIVNLQERLEKIEIQSIVNSKVNKAIFNFDELRNTLKTDLLAYLLTSNPNLKKSILDLEMRRTDQEPELFKALKARPDFEDDFRRMEQTYRKTSGLRKKILDAIENKQNKLALTYYDSYSFIYEINSARLIDLRNRLETEAAMNRLETKEFYNWLLIFMLFIVLFGLAIILYSFKYYKENLLSPIERLKLGLNEIQKGYFPLINDQDSSSIEIQEIMKDFNETAMNLQNIKTELLAANENALNLAKIKSDFLSNMSHEIRTPLNSIIGMCDILQDFKHEKEVEDYISTIVNSGNLLLNIVNDILDLSKLETGKIELDPVPFDINEFVGRINSSFTHLFKEKKLYFRVLVLPETPKFIMADSNRLEQIVLNLLSNAYKFTPTGGVTLTISVRDDMLQFKIEDTGIGIDSNMQSQLFTRFTQADSSITKQYGGTGLGLSIVKELVELMNGKIEVSSSAGSGSCFIVLVPLSEVTNQELQQPSNTKETADQFLNQFATPPNILLVDDSKENRKVVNLFLNQLEITIDEATNGVEAIAAYDRNKYDLILMDVQMPVLDGHSATIKIREMESRKGNKRIPIIALTAFVMQEEIKKSKAAGCDAHLSKPINRDLLVNTVIQYLNQ